MENNMQQTLRLKRNFGGILIALGIIPLSFTVFVFVISLLGFDIFNGLFSEMLKDLSLLILWISVLVNNGNLKLHLNNTDFNSYYQMILVGEIIAIAALGLYWIGFFFIWGTAWYITLLVYDAMILCSLIFLIIAWVKLGKFGESMGYGIRHNLIAGTRLLIVGAIIQILPLILDILGSIFISDYDALLVLILIIGFIQLTGLIFDLIGYIKVGNSFRLSISSYSYPEPRIGDDTSMYGGISPIHPITPQSTPQENSKEIKYCMKCGSLLIPDAGFCPKCGWEIKQF